MQSGTTRSDHRCVSFLIVFEPFSIHLLKPAIDRHYSTATRQQATGNSCAIRASQNNAAMQRQKFIGAAEDSQIVNLLFVVSSITDFIALGKIFSILPFPRNLVSISIAAATKAHQSQSWFSIWTRIHSSSSGNRFDPRDSRRIPDFEQSGKQSRLSRSAAALFP